MSAPEERTMRVFVDARWTRVDQIDGISRYGANLFGALHRLYPITMLIHDERQLRILPPHVPYVKINNPLSPRELLLDRTLNRLGADVVFSPMQVIGGFRRRYALVLTLHDLIYYRHPQPPRFLSLPVRVAWRLYHKAYWPQRVLLNRADAVVAVSETTRSLIARYRLTRRPVTVVHNAPSAPEPVGDPPAVHETGKDLLYMGSFMPYKNVETLISGMADLPEYTLHLLSRIPPAREAELRALIPAEAKVRFWRGISESDYQALLSSASALVTASRDEGFGLPVIEAMHAGTPVVCSDLEIFREVTGGHAAFFPADSPGEFVAAVRGLEDERTRKERVAAGRDHAATFSWRRSAQRLLDLLRTVTR
jgi:glycosyltransferase involved in cell wall biosynthesis